MNAPCLRSALAGLLALPLACAAWGQPPPKTPVDASPEHIAELIAKLEGADMAQRVRAMAAYKELVRIGKPAVPQLVEASQSPKPYVRVWSAAALGASGDRRAVQPMLRLFNDPVADVRKITVWHGAGLHKFDEGIAPAVVERLGDTSIEVRQWATRAINERIGLAKATPHLEAMTHSDSPNGRTFAFKLLLAARKQSPLPTIRKALHEAKDWHVRSAAIRCVGEGVCRHGKDMVDLIFLALKDSSEEVRADAVELTEFVLKEPQALNPELRRKVTERLETTLPPVSQGAIGPPAGRVALPAGRGQESGASGGRAGRHDRPRRRCAAIRLASAGPVRGAQPQSGPRRARSARRRRAVHPHNGLGAAPMGHQRPIRVQTRRSAGKTPRRHRRDPQQAGTA